MPDWAIPFAERVGWPAFLIVCFFVSVGLGVSRGLWPFWLSQVWPEILKQREHQRKLADDNSGQLKALYDVVIKSTSDYATTNLRVERALEEMAGKFSNSIRMIEDMQERRFNLLLDKLDKYTDATNALIEQWQSMALRPFVERRQSERPFVGPDKRQR